LFVSLFSGELHAGQLLDDSDVNSIDGEKFMSNAREIPIQSIQDSLHPR
jgi:hypothetical protein